MMMSDSSVPSFIANARHEKMPQLDVEHATLSTNQDRNNTSCHKESTGKVSVVPAHPLMLVDHATITKKRVFLDSSKVFSIMDSLQQEQKNSSQLIGVLREEQKRALKMKWGILAAVLFAVLLALSNIATSIATAHLAGQTGVQTSTNDLVHPATQERLATTSKMVGFAMVPIPASQRRHLQETESFLCGLHGSTSEKTHCEIQGHMNFDDAAKLYKEFCPSWPEPGVCSGVFSVLLTCNGKHSELFGGIRLPESGPSLGTDPVNGKDYAFFPTEASGYTGIQMVPEPTTGDSCSQVFNTGMYCHYDGSPCLVFSSWSPGSCEGAVQLCGEVPTEVN